MIGRLMLSSILEQVCMEGQAVKKEKEVHWSGPNGDSNTYRDPMSFPSFHNPENSRHRDGSRASTSRSFTVLRSQI